MEDTSRLFKRGFVFGLAILAICALSLPSVFANTCDEDKGIPGGTLCPEDVRKFVTPLIIPPAMPNALTPNGDLPPQAPPGLPPGYDYYEIAVAQFDQQIVPAGDAPPTTVWSYGPYADFESDGTGKHVTEGGSFFYPAFTVENRFQKPVAVKWINALVDGSNNYRPHLVPVDPTLHWANPPGGLAGRDTRPTFTNTPGPYDGPVPMVVHVHGAHTYEQYDGYAESWYLPAAVNIPAGYATTGTFFDYFNDKYAQTQHGPFAWEPGAATFVYPNSQRATTLWYHDHTLGMTRTNVYAGPAGFWLIRGGPDDVVRKTTGGLATLPGPGPDEDTNPFDHVSDRTIFEIPIAIQDRSFDSDGWLFYPDTREFFDGFAGPYIPGGELPDDNGEEVPSDIAPIWQPEFFGNMMVVNGQTWPYMNVEPRRYRLRLLNGCNSRFLILALQNANGFPYQQFLVDNDNVIHQIGAEGGFLPEPVEPSYPVGGNFVKGLLLMGPAERADVIVDFSGFAAGTQLILRNLGPDEPFGGGEIFGDFDASNLFSTGLVMKFNVVAASNGADPSTPVDELILPRLDGFRQRQIDRASERKLLLFEEESALLCWDEEDPDSVVAPTNGTCPEGTVLVAPKAALLGTFTVVPNEPDIETPLLWSDDITENPMVGDIEKWVFRNRTMDAHPIHVHQVMFQVLGREVIGGGDSIAGSNLPLPTETGWKDTVIAYPDEETTIIAKFDLPGFYVWHCHIVEHEDNEMMRPFHVGPIPADAPAQ